MSSIRSRFSTPIQLFILVFYFVLVIVIKHVYDNNQRNKRFEQYNVMLNEVAETLEVVEKHAKETARAVKAIENVMNHKKNSNPIDQHRVTPL